MASRKAQKEQLRAERLRREAEEQVAARRRRLIQYGTGAGLLAVIVVVAAIVVSQSSSSGSGAGGGGDVVDASLVSKQLQGIPQNGTVLGGPEGGDDDRRIRRPPVPGLQGVLVGERARPHLTGRSQGDR